MSLHSVVGTWVLLIYLMSALTGLWWSFDWYRNAANTLLGVAYGKLRLPPTRHWTSIASRPRCTRYPACAPASSTCACRRSRGRR